MTRYNARMKEISIDDRPLFLEYLSAREHRLSAFTFENIYLWKDIFSINWTLVDQCLCVFFCDKIGSFMYLPPLGGNVRPEVIEEAFNIMDSVNHNNQVSRVENIEEGELDLYRGFKLRCRKKYPEYVCRRAQQAGLTGNGFKHKRAACNYFVKNFAYDYLPFSLKDKSDCLKLYARWSKSRQDMNKDPVYCGLMQDSHSCLKALLDNYQKMDLSGRIVRIENQIKAFTFGFPVNEETFCVFFEITDLSVKGLAQFIFREFCSELKEYKYINIMDDSGLENLARVKASYRPVELVSAYIADRQL